jgi:Zinc carboxypeptidase
VFQENRVQEPETLAVMSWIKSNSFQLSANLHGGSLVSNYPFDNTPNGQSVYSKSPDDATFRMLAESYSLVSNTMHMFYTLSSKVLPSAKIELTLLSFC